MKREVASSLVERGVAERVRLTQAYEKKKTDLQKQHDIVKTQLNEHKEKVRLVDFDCYLPESRFTDNASKNIASFFIDGFLCVSFCMCVVLPSVIIRQRHYWKKRASLGHAFRRIVFWCYFIRIAYRKRPRKMVDHPVKIQLMPKRTHKKPAPPPPCTHFANTPFCKLFAPIKWNNLFFLVCRPIG